MTDTISQAKGQDALNVQEISIVLDGKPIGFISSVSVDRRQPEELLNCIGCTLRRAKPEEYEWRSDGVVLYNNLHTLKDMENKLFQIVMVLTNPDPDAPSNNKTSTIVVRDCRISNHNFSVSDSSTFNMDGRCRDWVIQ